MKILVSLTCLSALFVSSCAASGKPKEAAVDGSPAASLAAENKRQAKVRPPVKIGPDAIVDKELAVIWGILVDVEDWGSWMTKVTKVEPGAGLSPGALIKWQWDEKDVESEIISVKVNEEFSFKSCASSKKAVVKWALKSMGPKRTLISLRAEVPYGTASETMDKLGPEMTEWATALQAAALKAVSKK